MRKPPRPATIIGITLCLVAIATAQSAGQDTPSEQAASGAQPAQAQSQPSPSTSSSSSAGGQPTSATPKPAPAKGDDLEGEVISAEAIYKIPPVYPLAAKQRGIQGVVRLRAVIGADGRVRELTVISGHPLLVQAAREAVSQWRYRPATFRGSPVSVQTEIDANFNLQPWPGSNDRANIVSPGIVPAVAILHPAPPYTDKARSKGREGKIVLFVTVDERGNVKDVSEASKKLGDGLDKSAIETVKTWRFNPATRGGAPFPVRIAIPLNFRLPESPAQASPEGDSAPPPPGS